ncbi:hypothetical protein KFK09_004741 [Dendrobium nobile]|uniref:non-specific serine/threonine protein kinase n=1 Tax=Dendrobium nobile TaxID=94219 RepID=A0A8T3BW85_DENNO|nr:hypothetical protein KFK09_004741 [Dendrobium nobile]
MSESDSPPASENSSSSDNAHSGDSLPPSLGSSSSPLSQNSTSSPPSPASSSSPPSAGSRSTPPSQNSSSSPPSPASSSSPPSAGSNSSPPSQNSSSSPPSAGSSSSPPSPASSSSPPSAGSSSSPPSQNSSSSPPSPASSSSPPSAGSSSSPPSKNSSSSPPSPVSSSSPPSAGSSLSSPPSSPSSILPPPSKPSSSSTPGTSNSSSSSPSPPSLIPPPPSPPSPIQSDSPSQSKSSDGDSSPPISSKSGSSPSPPNSIASDESSSSSSLPSPPSQGNQNADKSPSVGDVKSPSKPSQPNSSQGSIDGSPATPSDSLSLDEKPTQTTPHVSPLSIASSNVSVDKGGTSTGAIVSLILVGVAITLVTIFFAISRRKKKRLDALVDHYRQPPSFSVKSDNYYHRNENPMGHPNFSEQHYGAPTQLSNTSGLYGSQRRQDYYSQPDPSGSKSWFNYEELMGITNGFSHENLIGEGGFGCVYKGALPDGKCVAVKQLKAGGGQGEREFRAEVEIISRVHHRHLVSLVGYSIFETQRLLVYEFVPNKTLEHHLHGKWLPVMDWPKRLKIAIGSAKGLAYLHEDCHPRIIHRDIKSANILIDNDWEAQVADFGLAKLSNDTHTHVSTRVMGTFGYLAPEYASSGKLTDRSDVFSFGVVLLELITGRKPVDASQPMGDESLVEWVLRALDCEGDMEDLSNGMKFGQSQVFDSGQHSADIQRFRRMALGTDDFTSEYGYSNEYDRRSSPNSEEYRSHSREYHRRVPQNRDLSNSQRSGESSGEYSGESETRAMFHKPVERSDVGSYRYGSRGFP